MGLSKYLPKNHIDAMAMGFTFFMIPVGYLHGVLYIAPTIWPTDDSNLPEEITKRNVLPYYCSVFVMTFLFINTYANLILTVTTDTSCGRVPLPVVEQPGWYFCPYCRFYAPPRAHHCPTCQKCIMRRDHHCFFAGKCIGYYNHRYFIAFLIYLILSSLYGIITSSIAIYHMLGGFSLALIPAFIFPVLAWIFQMMPIPTFVMLMTSVAFFVTLCGAGLLGLQMYEIAKGQTYHELQKSIDFYGRSRFENCVDALGKNWWFCWVFPFIPSPRLGDGSHYSPMGGAGPREGAGNNMMHTKRKTVKST